MGTPTNQQVMAHITGWPRQLSWWNFKKVDAVPAGFPDNSDAFTTAEFSWAGATAKNKDQKYYFPNVRVTVRLVQDQTWVLKDVAKGPSNALVLKHEQGHYNITGLAARDLCRDLMQLEEDDPDTLKSSADSLCDYYLGVGGQVQDTYEDPVDGTDYGNNPSAQTRWSAMISDATKSGATVDSLGP